MRASPKRFIAAGLLGLVVAGAAADGPRRYDGASVVRIAVTSAAELEQVLALGGDVWSDYVRVGPLDVLVTPEQLAALDALGLSYYTLIDDVQPLIEAQRQPAGRDWFDAYHPLEEIFTYLDGLIAAYPALAQPLELGMSLEGRPLRGIRIAGPALDPFAPAVFYFAGMHAREWIGPTAPQYFANYLLSNYGTDLTVTELVNHVEFLLVPVCNPDGYVYSWGPERLWRKNRRDNGNGTFGVDLNRNFSVGWGGEGSSPTPSSNLYRGPEPFSEPESCAVRDFYLARPNIRTQNDIHSYSQLILWPWGYQPAYCPDEPAFLAVGQVLHDLILGVHGFDYDFGATYHTIYAASGVTVDWSYGARQVFAFSFELRDTGQYGFVLPAAQIIANNQEILPALLYLAGCSAVRATQIRCLDGFPPHLIAGQDTPIRVAITSAAETLDPNTARLFYRYHPDAPYAEVALAPAGGVEFDAVLPATHCGAQPEWYVSITGSAGTTYEPAGAPAVTRTATMQSGTIVFSDDLADDPGWTTTGLWAWGQPLGQGGVHPPKDPNKGHTGLNVYGYNLSGDYPNNMLAEETLTTTAIDCTGQFGLRLSFWRWLGVEDARYDHAALRVSNDGVNWTTIWQNPTLVNTLDPNAWVPQDYDISAVADDQPTVYLRWTMGPSDSGWAACGWNIDDVQIYATGCEGRPGDWNGDRVVDGDDLAGLDGCLAGPELAAPPGCAEVFELTGDGRVDLADCAALQSLAGP